MSSLRARLARLRARIWMVVLIGGVILFIIFLLQNTRETPVEFLIVDITIPSAILMLVTSLGGFAAGYLVALRAGRRGGPPAR